MQISIDEALQAMNDIENEMPNSDGHTWSERWRALFNKFLYMERSSQQAVQAGASCCKGVNLNWNNDHTKWVCFFCGRNGTA